MHEEANQPPSFEHYWDWSDDEQGRIEDMSNRQVDAMYVFSELSESADEFGYWRARATIAGLWDLVLLDHQLAVHPPVESFVDQGARLHALLPFNQDELQQLVGRMEENALGSAEYADRWYENATPQDTVLLGRWRQWLDTNFPSYKVDPSGAARALLLVLDDMSSVFADIK